MAAVDISAENLRSSCAVCRSEFQWNENRPAWLDSILFRSVKIHVCSSMCRYQLQYKLGIIHGFLLCDILHQFVDLNTVNCKTGLIYSAHSPGYTHLCDNTSENMNFHSKETSSASIPVKKEEPDSDLDDFDCTVSFQNSAHDEIDIHGQISDSESQVPATRFSKKSAKAVNKNSCVRVSKSNVSDTDTDSGRKQKVGYSTPERLVKRKKLNQKSGDVLNKKSVYNQPKTKISNKKEAERKLRSTLKRKHDYVHSEHLTKGRYNSKRCKPAAEESEEEETTEMIEMENGEATIYQCDFCSKSFTAKRFFQRHLNRFHPKEIEISCDVCGECCKNQKCLTIHMRKEHNLKPSEGEEIFYCDQCTKSFNSRRGLALHKEFVHSQENPVNCQLCDLTLKNDIYLKRHMKRSHSDSIICHICGAQFKSRLALTSHLSAHKGVKSFFCEVCGMGFVRKTSLRRHVQQHTDVSYTCDSCSSSYKTWGSLSLHMLQTHQRGSYFNNRLKSAEKLGYVVNKEAVERHLHGQCVTCGQTLVSGVCASHPESYALMFRCHRCELTAEHVDDLLAHLRDHDSGTSASSICVSFDCKVCHKVFPRKLYLNQHLKKHHPGASMSSLSLHPTSLTYRCQICGKQFQQKQYLYVHMKQHLQPGTFSCHVCDRKFTYKCNLKNHLTTHSEDKPFKCDICLKVFRRKEVLSSHRLVHNPNQSPFKCHLCGKGLSRKQYLKKHYQIVHPEWQESQGMLASLPPLLPLSSSSQLPPPSKV